MAFESMELLGKGGFGTVELVRDKTGQVFARKTFSINQPIAPSLVDNVKKRFTREVNVQKGFSHKNIVPVLGGDLKADPPYFLMPAAEC